MTRAKTPQTSGGARTRLAILLGGDSTEHVISVRSARAVLGAVDRERYEALMSGEIDAATLMEPWISLAEKKGCKKIIETHYLGVENASIDLDGKTLEALMRAVRKVVRNINADNRRSLCHLLSLPCDAGLRPRNCSGLRRKRPRHLALPRFANLVGTGSRPCRGSGNGPIPGNRNMDRIGDTRWGFAARNGARLVRLKRITL